MRDDIMNTPQQINLRTDELQQVLEPLIRRIIREELFKVIQQTSNIFFLTLYKDMEEIAQRKASHDIELLPHNEVWKQHSL